MSRTDRGLTLLVLSEDGREVRSLHMTRARIRTAVVVAGLLLTALGVMVGTWWYFALRSMQVPELRDRIAALESERSEVAELAATLGEVEAEYERLRSIFGSGSGTISSDLWLPPPSSTRRGAAGEGVLNDSTPDSWPLTEPGYVTQPLLAGASGDHPGLDIAVPSDSYIRAAGAGTIAEAASDSTYGNFVVLDHGSGYRTRYAHASLLLIDVGQAVRKNEVIALTGSTGRSTAPHLHFEILRDGEAIDPLTMVAPPGG